MISVGILIYTANTEGILLVKIGVVANNKLFSVAFVIVEVTTTTVGLVHGLHVDEGAQQPDLYLILNWHRVFQGTDAR